MLDWLKGVTTKTPTEYHNIVYIINENFRGRNQMKQRTTRHICTHSVLA